MENKTKSPHHKVGNEAKTVSTRTPAPVSTPAQNNANKHNNLAIASMVTGIVAVLICTLPVVGLILGVVALILGIISIKKTNDKGMAIAGISTGGLSILINIMFILFIIIGLAIFEDVTSHIDTNGNITNQTIATPKTDFLKGETANFNNLQVKINSLTRNYSPKDEINKASVGKELVVVNFSVKNTSQYPIYIDTTDIRLNADGVTNSASTLAVEPILATGELSSNATTTGNIIFEIKKDATNLKLQYEAYNDTINDMGIRETQMKIYTLGL